MADPLDYVGKIISISSSEETTDMLPVLERYPGFPYELAYVGQIEALDKIFQSHEVLLTSHTGSGKTAVFLAVTHNKASLIIEPRKFLQKQVGKVRGDFVLFGRSEYQCDFGCTADIAPCRGRKYTKIITDPLGKNEKVSYFKATDPITGEKKLYKYPCEDCKYLKAVGTARLVLGGRGTVIVNHHNFKQFLGISDVVIVDEADLCFKELSSAKNMKFVREMLETVDGTLEKEADLTANELEILTTKAQSTKITKDEEREILRKIDRLENHQAAIGLLHTNAVLCFQYEEKDEETKEIEKVCVEIKPNEINMLKNNLFEPILRDKKKKFILVTATPSFFKATDIVSYEVYQRSAIFYAKVGLLTARHVKEHPEVLETCARFIKDSHEMFKRIFENDAKKTIVHCTSFNYQNQILKYLGGEGICDVHKSGKLMETVNRFKNSPAEYLLVSSMEQGADFDDIIDQYIVKVPYSNPYDGRSVAYRNEVGDREFNRWYETDALNRMIQASGRVGRGANGRGFTFICDIKFGDLYRKYRSTLPKHFVSRISRGGTL